jgi:hypothetical protein
MLKLIKKTIVNVAKLVQLVELKSSIYVGVGSIPKLGDLSSLLMCVCVNDVCM